MRLPALLLLLVLLFPPLLPAANPPGDPPPADPVQAALDRGDAFSALHILRTRVGRMDQEAAKRLQEVYALGYGVPEQLKDEVSDIEWQVSRLWYYQRLADQGNPNELLLFGFLHESGVSPISVDHQKSLSFYRRAAEEGMAEAMYRLGLKYFYGEATAVSPQEAASWFEKAAAKGHAPAQNMLAQLHLDGLGVPQDPQRAHELLEQAAGGEHARARYQLAVLHLKGHGVAPDSLKAHMWYNLAAALRLEEAARERNALGSHFSFEELLQAQAMARSWLEQLHAQGEQAHGEGEKP